MPSLCRSCAVTSFYHGEKKSLWIFYSSVQLDFTINLEYFRDSEYVNACQEIDGSSTIEEILSSGIQVGDIIYFDWESDGVLDHSVIVTEISDDEVYLTYHSTDRERQALSVLLDPKMEGYLLLFKD